MSTLTKGQISQLNVTQEARRRVFVGLGWDPNENTSLLDKAKAFTQGKDIEHDLDLSCYVFDHQGRYISHVAAIHSQHTDQTGQIYHSGDNVEGIGDGDDEQISVELKGLDEAIHSIIFVASIKSGQVFSEVADAQVRLVDGYSNRCFLSEELGDDVHDSFVFVEIFRNAQDADNWHYHVVGEYINGEDGSDAMAQRLKTYLTE